MINKRNKLLLVGYYGKGNFGDQLMLYGLLKNLQDCELVVLAYDEIPFVYPDVKYEIIYNKGRNIFYRITLICELIKELKGIDIVLWGGGTCFYDNVVGGWHLFFGVLKMYALAKLLRKKVGFVGIGIGDIVCSHNLTIARYLIKKSNIMTCRDVNSYNFAKKYNTNVHFVEDLAFLQHVNISKVTRGGKKKVVFCGMSCSKIKKCNDRDIIHDIVRVLDNLIENDYKIEMLPMHIGKEADDAIFHLKIIERMRYGKLVIKRQIGLDQIAQTMNTMESADIVVSMRLHGLVAGRLAKKPIIAIGDSKKIVNFMNDNGLAQYQLNYNEIDKLQEIIHFLEGNKGLFLVDDCETKYEFAKKNIDLIKNELRKNTANGES